MKKIVKFGGSSLADANQFKKVYDIITSDESRHYVVPSAPGRRYDGDTKVTDLLYAAYYADDEATFKKTFEEIKDRYNSIIAGLKLDLSLEEEYQTIEKDFKAKIGVNYAASRGEYLNGIILANYLGFDFIDPATCIYIDSYGNYDYKKTDAILEKTLKNHDYAVIPGFYGQANDESGAIQTFSRGGSDVTGSVIARNSDVDLYENWTDVSGCLVCDPRIVDNPETIETITYKELRELSYMGASVLHENSIFPIRSQGIPIVIKNTNRPQDKGTIIVESTCHKPSHIITGIAGKKDMATIMIEKDMMNAEIGFGRKVLQVLEENGLSFEHMPSGIDTMTIVVNTKDFIEKEQNVIAGIHRAVNPDSITLESGLALIAIVGRGMKDGRGTAAKIFKSLANANINVKMIDQGSSELNIIVGVKNVHFEKAINAIYDEFITKEEA
ncbi:MAG: aspartate kinase [Erysipelotrichaceae bacterium]|nr:aspartate kinase [Erysipelotrichaceae bacterium]MDD3809930.1 aspartate kinase [Erysipelotrichaceae bacterium]